MTVTVQLGIYSGKVIWCTALY